MIDREKVIEGLKHCPVYCNPECPCYWNDISDFTECQIRLHVYAIDLLEEREQSQREYEAAVEMGQYCERYEPTYNPEDGSL